MSTIYYSIKKGGTEDVTKGVGANFEIVFSMGKIPPISHFEVRDIVGAVVGDFVDAEYVIEIGTLRVMDAYLKSMVFSKPKPSTLLKLAFEPQSYRRLRETYITSFWQDQTIAEIVNAIIGEADVSARTVIGTDLISSLQFDRVSALDCLLYIVDKYDYVFFLNKGEVVFVNDWGQYGIPSGKSFGSVLGSDIRGIRFIKDRVNGELISGYWIRVDLTPDIQPGEMFTILSDEINLPTLLAHTIVHKAIADDVYTEILATQIDLEPNQVNNLNTGLFNDFLTQMSNLITKRVEMGRGMIVANAEVYDYTSNKVDAVFGYTRGGPDSSSTPDPTLNLITESNPDGAKATKIPILCGTALDQYGRVKPVYPGERLLVARINNNDMVVLGKIYTKDLNLPPLEENDDAEFIPAGGSDSGKARIHIIDKDGNEILHAKSLVIRIGDDYLTLSRPEKAGAGLEIEVGDETEIVYQDGNISLKAGNTEISLDGSTITITNGSVTAELSGSVMNVS